MWTYSRIHVKDHNRYRCITICGAPMVYYSQRLNGITSLQDSARINCEEKLSHSLAVVRALLGWLMQNHSVSKQMPARSFIRTGNTTVYIWSPAAIQCDCWRRRQWAYIKYVLKQLCLTSNRPMARTPRTRGPNSFNDSFFGHGLSRQF